MRRRASKEAEGGIEGAVAESGGTAAAGVGDAGGTEGEGEASLEAEAAATKRKRERRWRRRWLERSRLEHEGARKRKGWKRK